MALTSRVTLMGPPAEDPEDLFSSALGVIFPGEVTVLHGDSEHGLSYTSPHLPKALHLSLANPSGEEARRLFGHYLWNSSLLLAELIEAGTLRKPSQPATGTGQSPSVDSAEEFSVTDLTIVELGAGVGLPSLLSALLGARRVVVTDYPAPFVLANLGDNVARNVDASFSPLGSVAVITVEGHSWGDVSTTFAQEHRAGFDRVFVCDLLYMPWHHTNLRDSIAWFLKDTSESRCWVVGGFHTGRQNMCGFFDEAALKSVGLEIEKIWERDCDGEERAWEADRGTEDIGIRKRWLVVAILRRCREEGGGASK